MCEKMTRTRLMIKMVRRRVSICDTYCATKRDKKNMFKTTLSIHTYRVLEITRCESIETTLRTSKTFVGGDAPPNERRAIAKANHVRKP